MKRSFNYTQRKKLERSRIRVSLGRTDAGERKFDAAIALEGLELEAEARVYVEAYVRRSLMRFDFGRVARPSAQSATILSEIDPSDQVFFRIKVVDQSGTNGKVLAVADAIVPIDPGASPSKRVPLLEVVYAADLGQQLWVVEFNEVSGPFLKVNAEIPGAQQFLKDARVRALILPSVLRSVLSYIAFVQGTSLTDDDSESWPGQWLAVARRLWTEEPPAKSEEEDESWPVLAREWIEQVVKAFAGRHGALNAYNAGSKEDRQ